jgi:hypothetical protein
MTDTYNPAIFERDVPSERPSLGETVSATIGYRINPLIDRLEQGFRHGALRQQGYDPLQDIEGYEQYAPDLVRAVSPEHMADMKASINESIQRRETLADATLGNQLLSGLLDPINLIALPLGGPVTSIGRAALKAGVSVAAVEAAYETAVMQPFDPVQSAEESALNVLTAGLFGGAIGGAIAVPNIRLSQAHQRTTQALGQQFDVMRRIDNLDGLTASDIASARPRDERGFGDLDDDTISTRVSALEGQAKQLDDQAEAGALGDDLRVQAEELRAESRQLRNELGLRALENDGVDLADPYRIMPSWFTESPAFQLVTTPFKRALQSTYPSRVKEAFVRSFSDSGTALAMNAFGVRTPQSVYQRTAVANGRWVAAHDKMVRLWAADTGTSPTTRLDINFTDVTRRASRSEDTYRNWLRNVNEKRIKNIEDLTENEIKAVEVINSYFKDAEARLEDVGLIGTRKGIQNRIGQLEDEISTLEARLARAESRSTARSRQEADMLKGRLNRLRANLDNERLTLDSFDEVSLTGESEDVFFPRFWDQGAIRKNRQQFSDTLYSWYEQNPRTYVLNEQTGRYELKELSTEPNAIRERVDQTIARILNETDPTNVDNIGFGYGRSKHFRHRQVDIPNKLVTDFIITDPLAAMKTYAARIEPRYEYAKQFGKDVDGVLLDLETEMLRDGASTDEINRMRRDYLHLYDRVAGAVIRDPSSLDQKAAFVLREAASFSYMGSAGLAALPDFGRIVMEYDMDNIVRGVQAMMDQNMVNLTVDEVRLAGEAIDILKGTAHMRMVEDLGNNIDANDLLTSARNAFYILNGLSPMTGLAKQLAGVVDGHTIIDYSIKLGRGELDDQGRTWLARYGIGEEQAREIARAPWTKTDNGLYLANTEQWTDSIYVPEIEGQTVRIVELNEDGTPVGKTRNGRYIPASYDPETNTIRFDRDYIEGPMFESKAWLNPRVEGVDALPDIFKTPKQWSNFVMLHEIMHTRVSANDLGLPPRSAEYENRINQMALEEYRNQQTVNQETVQTFRTALNSGVLNTIMSGTPADKPIITDGTAYIPMRIARQFGMQEDARFRGYARVQNGFLGLPFQFYSYTLANVNKTVAALATGQVKNRAIGIGTMMGLAYLSLKLRTPDFVWEDMTVQDKFARSFDMSGVMALYSDLFYTSMHTSLALGGPNITGGILSPKFPQEPSMLDAVTGFAGAGPSWLADTATGIYEFANGDYAGGGKTVARNLPFARLWFWKDEVNQITHAWAN